MFSGRLKCEGEKNAQKGAAKYRKGSVLPLYCPDSMMPSVVEAKLVGLQLDSEGFKAPGALG